MVMAVVQTASSQLGGVPSTTYISNQVSSSVDRLRSVRLTGQSHRTTVYSRVKSIDFGEYDLFINCAHHYINWVVY